MAREHFQDLSFNGKERERASEENKIKKKERETKGSHKI